MAEPRSTPRSNLAVRVMTAVVTVPVILWMLFAAPTWVWPGFLLLATAVTASELFGMTMGAHTGLKTWGVLASLATAAIFYFLPDHPDLLHGLLLLVPASLIIALGAPEPHGDAGTRSAWLVAGPLYVGGLLSSLASLHQLPQGGAWVVMPMLLAWFSDTGGYFAGRFLGKHPLAPRISPKKTWEGSIGGLLAALVGALGCRAIWLPELPWYEVALLAAIAAPVGMCGDLCASLIKRSTGQKDSGWIVPGHGGLLDRIDALLFTSVLTLAYARLLAY